MTLSHCSIESTDKCSFTEEELSYVELNHDYKAFLRLERAQACSKQSRKPIFVLYDCYACGDPEAPWEILQDEEIKQLLEERFVIAALAVDDYTKLEPIDSSNLAWNGKVMTTVGHFNVNFQIEKFQTNTWPLFAIVDQNLNVLAPHLHYVPVKEKQRFIEFLKTGLKNQAASLPLETD